MKFLFNLLLKVEVLRSQTIFIFSAVFLQLPQKLKRRRILSYEKHCFYYFYHFFRGTVMIYSSASAVVTKLELFHNQLNQALVSPFAHEQCMCVENRNYQHHLSMNLGKNTSGQLLKLLWREKLAKCNLNRI